ncbi:MAG: hypothetical protein QNK89_02745 [Lacinutrix sp.]|uniref:hypothetical protein n=1 Tax=Lacinutrix sp. TaxID=1937692 RepID=UPI0030969C08
MKNFLNIILVLLVVSFTSCKVSKTYKLEETKELFALFKTIKIEDTFLKIEKKQITLTTQNKIEEPYRLMIPNISIYQTSGTFSSIPSEHIFKYDNGSSIYIVKNGHLNSNKIKFQNHYLLKKKEFLDLIWKNNISNIDDVKLKNNKFHGVRFYNEIAILYINAKEKDLELFNKSISSLKK